jgi:prepilin-type N-terminal cleavage/methylation domain-containing protein
MREKARPRKQKGFTLIEMVVVLAILTLLTGITFAVVWQGRRRSDLTVCTHNLKQIYQALQMYEQDNGFLPFNPFGDELAPYHKSPSVTVHLWYDWTGTPVKTYSLFICPSNSWLWPPWVLVYDPNPPRPVPPGYYEKYFPGATNYAWAMAGGYSLAVFEGDFILMADWPEGVHQGGQNHLFDDGHVKWARGCGIGGVASQYLAFKRMWGWDPYLPCSN